MGSIIILLSLIVLIRPGYSSKQEQLINFLDIATTVHCEGKDSANYTYVDPYQLTSDCDTTYLSNTPEWLLACNGTSTSVINLQELAESVYPAGAYFHYEALYLCTSGTLEGKYMYIQEINLVESYLKRCSSVLGYSYVSSKSSILLIAEKLDVGMFVNPGGAFIAFKKAATTVCTGQSTIV